MKLDFFKIKLALARAEMNIHDLAVVLGCSDQNVRKILVKDSCNLKTLGRLAKAIGCDPSELVSMDD